MCVAECRGFVERALESRPTDLIDRAVLVTSERVTNVILHTPNGGLLELVVATERLRLEVSDISLQTPMEVPHDNTSDYGRGLPIVESLADDWGIRLGGAGKTVWASFKPRSTEIPPVIRPSEV
jgi:anti-sigma regulatory factor (Ser/Thr protein kinase)